METAQIEKEQVKEQPHYMGHRKRLRARLIASPKGTLPDYEILEILLFAASPRGDVKPLAKDLLKKFGNIANVINADENALMHFKGMSDAAIAQFRVVQETIERMFKCEVEEKTVLQSWKALLDYCRASMGHLKKEQFRLLFLDKKNVLLSDELQDAGTIDQTPIYPREIVKRALQLEASAVIMVHNHPSGDTIPSKADIEVTKKVIEALGSVNIKLHDHLIVSRSSHYSFRAHAII